MNVYALQALYRRVRSPGARLLAIRTARALGLRTLLVRIDTNDACNLRCPMCPLGAPDWKPAARPMPVDTFTRIAREVFPRTRLLYLSCGTEPLVTPHFDELLGVVARHRPPFVSYCTNGLLLRDRFIAATVSGAVDEVILSVDGATKATYERIRVGGRFEVLEERLTALTEARQRPGARSPAIRFNFTVQQDNCHELVAFARWMLRFRPATLQLRFFRPLAGAPKQHDESRTFAEYQQALPEVQRICAEHRIELLAPSLPVAAACAVATQPAPAAAGSGPIDCQLPWFTLYLKANGDVHPCGVHAPVGNFLRDSFAAIERGPAMRTLRRSLRTAPGPTCVECQRTGASGV